MMKRYRIRKGSIADCLTDPSFYAGAIIMGAYANLLVFMLLYGC